MNEYFTKTFDWIKANPVMAAGAAIGALLLLKPGLFRAKRRRRRPAKAVSHRRTVRRRYNKAPAGKKAWQVKGSRAAKLRMARIRRLKAA